MPPTKSLLLFLIGVSLVKAEYKLTCNTNATTGAITCKADGAFDLEPLLLQGDILIDEDSSRNAVVDTRLRWPNRIVPYVFHSSYTQSERQSVLDAMNYISSRTCVRFQSHTGAGGYLLITKEPNCFANVGYTPNSSGYTRMNLQSNGCLQAGTIQHELLHVLGLYHEQSRPDRDNYVDITWSNIQSGRENNFERYSTQRATTYGVPYDYSSLMHYDRFAFAINRAVPTITARGQPNLELGQRVAARANDLEKVRRMYSCA